MLVKWSAKNKKVTQCSNAYRFDHENNTYFTTIELQINSSLN